MAGDSVPALRGSHRLRRAPAPRAACASDPGVLVSEAASAVTPSAACVSDSVGSMSEAACAVTPRAVCVFDSKGFVSETAGGTFDTNKFDLVDGLDGAHRVSARGGAVPVAVSERTCRVNDGLGLIREFVAFANSWSPVSCHPHVHAP